MPNLKPNKPHICLKATPEAASNAAPPFQMVHGGHHAGQGSQDGPIPTVFSYMSVSVIGTVLKKKNWA